MVHKKFNGIGEQDLSVRLLRFKMIYTTRVLLKLSHLMKITKT